jgi:poly-gamma-glutamate synthesis protein (capsule biosynthesis protein)
MLGDHPHYLGIGVRSTIEKKQLYIFEKVEKVLSEADIVFGNLETVISDYGKINSYESLILRGKPEFVEQLRRGHFNVINVANNHIQQHGKQCLFDTVSVLQQNGIRLIGIDNLQPQIIYSSKGIKFGFLGYSLRPEQYDNEVIYSQGNKEKIISDISKIRKTVDYLIVSLHWGDEYISFPSVQQINLAHEIIDAGVDIIIGHHPHVLQPVEKYKNRIIAYSLGNFVSDMCSDVAKKSAILKIIFDKKSIKDVDLIPIYINKNYQPEILADEKEIIPQIVETGKLLNSLNSQDYERILKQSLKRDRIEYFKFLTRNFYRFPVSTSFKIIYLAIRRRLIR